MFDAVSSIILSQLNIITPLISDLPDFQLALTG